MTDRHHDHRVAFPDLAEEFWIIFGVLMNVASALIPLWSHRAYIFHYCEFVSSPAVCGEQDCKHAVKKGKYSNVEPFGTGFANETPA